MVLKIHIDEDETNVQFSKEELIQHVKFSLRLSSSVKTDNPFQKDSNLLESITGYVNVDSF
tara:strand:+ start:173 stop:355 length:183 start_codon:yes stop_codon:yes gene_type:complete